MIWRLVVTSFSHFILTLPLIPLCFFSSCFPCLNSRYAYVKFERRRGRSRTQQGSFGARRPAASISAFRSWSSTRGAGSEMMTDGGGGGLIDEPPSAVLRDSDMGTTSPPFGNRHARSRPIILSSSFLHTGLVPLVNRDGVLVNECRRHDRGVRGADTDRSGRRGGGGADSVLGSHALEELPAYEAGKSPPNYHTVAFTSNPPPPPPPPREGDSPHPDRPPPIPFASRPGAGEHPENENGSSIPYRPSSSSSSFPNEEFSN